MSITGRSGWLVSVLSFRPVVRLWLANTVNTWATNDLLIAMNAYYCYVELSDCWPVHHSVFTVAVYTDIWALYFIPCSCVASHYTCMPPNASYLLEQLYNPNIFLFFSSTLRSTSCPGQWADFYGGILTRSWLLSQFNYKPYARDLYSTALHWWLL